MIRRLSGIACLWVWAVSVFAQAIDHPLTYWDQYRISNYGEKDGIISKQIYKIHKDQQDFYWLITNRQLLRFDGLEFRDIGKTFFSGTLYDLAEDSAGNFWIPSIGSGLFKFDRDTVISFKNITGDLVKTVALGANDTLITGTYGQGLKIIHNDSLVNSFTVDDGLAGNEIWTIRRDFNNRFWIGTNTGLSIFENGRFTNFDTSNGLLNDKIRSIEILKNEEVWVGTDSGGIIVFQNDKPVRTLGTEDGLTSLLIYSIKELPDGSVLIGTLGGGVHRMYNGSVEVLTTEQGLISNDINYISYDDDGLLFLGTEDGLSKLVPKIFGTISVDGESAFQSEAVTLNQDGKGRIWLGTYGQGYRVWEKDSWSLVEYPPVNTNGYAQSGAVDSHGNLWLGTQGTGVFEVVGNSLEPRLTTENGLLDNYVRGLTFDHDGNLWVGSNKGISVYDTELNLIHTYSEENEIPNPFCITLITASDGSVWYGSYGGGVVQFKDGRKKIYNQANGLRSDQVLSIYEDSGSNIWIGTFNYGLSKVTGDSLFTISTDDGLPRGNYAGIIEDDFGYLWLATGNGIIRISLEDIDRYQQKASENLPFHFFDLEDGLLSTNLQAGNNSTLLKLDDGKIMFASIDGVSTIDPAKFKFNSNSFSAYITEVKTDQKPQPVNEYNNIVLSPDNNRLEISYSAINYTAPAKTQYRVKLEDIDNDWIYVDDRTTSYYDYLPDGEYTFTVSARGPDGQWSPATASVSFEVLPPFYKTWWFRMLSLVAFGALIAGAVQVRSNIKVKRLNRELALQQKIQKERERISRDLHDNVGSQITNLITGIEISNLHLDKSQLTEVASTLSDLDYDARSAMIELRETIWLLDKNEVSLEAFIDHLKSYFKRQDRYLGKMKTRIQTDLSNSVILNPTQSHNLMRIIQETLNNAKKHAQASEFLVKLSVEGNRLKANLCDNGKGMELSKSNNSGNGLKNINQRARMLNAECEITSEQGKGTVIFLSFEV